LEAIDTLADTLNQRRPWQMTARLSDQPVTLWHLGKGGFGHIYKLSTRSKDYALKIFRPKQEVERKMRRELFLQALQAGDNPWGEAVDQSIYAAQLDNNPYREGAVGLFLRNKPVWDIARYHVGNPGKGWQLTELVDHRVDLARRKQEKPYRLNEVGLKFCDDPGTLARILSLNGLLEFLPVFRHLGNRIQGIRVDYGAMEGSYRVPKKTGR
jgi:hypothetical protein